MKRHLPPSRRLDFAKGLEILERIYRSHQAPRPLVGKRDEVVEVDDHFARAAKATGVPLSHAESILRASAPRGSYFAKRADEI